VSSALPHLILGSTSRYRADLLRRLGLAFSQRAPGVDEPELAGEPAPTRAMRLARAKAEAIAQGEHHAVVIGSDQVAELAGSILHKPGTNARAQAQLRASAGHSVVFHTAVCVRDTCNGQTHTHVDRTTVHFRDLRDDEIRRYIEREQPLDCAGSFKCEGLGIALFTHIETRDPTALIGLPLIALAQMLRDCGIELP
jgi:septum formation protein